MREMNRGGLSHFFEQIDGRGFGVLGKRKILIPSQGSGMPMEISLLQVVEHGGGYPVPLVIRRKKFTLWTFSYPIGGAQPARPWPKLSAWGNLVGPHTVGDGRKSIGTGG